MIQLLSNDGQDFCQAKSVLNRGEYDRCAIALYTLQDFIDEPLNETISPEHLF